MYPLSLVKFGIKVLMCFALVCCHEESRRVTLEEQSGEILPPPQPTSGPGGSDYVHDRALITELEVQTTVGRLSYVVYEPEAPRPLSAPILVFLMGNFYAASALTTQGLYSALYTHLARKGYVVIHPDNGYQKVAASVNDYDSVLAQVIQGALWQQGRGSRVRPIYDENGIIYALGGHSLGGILSQMIADQATKFGIPNPRSLLLIESTDRGIMKSTPSAPHDPGNLKIPDKWYGLPAATQVLHVRCNDSLLKAYGVTTLQHQPVWIWLDAEIRRMMVNIPNSHYSFTYLPRDDHGSEPVETHHLSIIGTSSPMTNFIVNALMAAVGPSVVGPFIIPDIFSVNTVDFNLWKRIEAMLNVTLKKNSEHRPYAYDENAGDLFRDMGSWSDGVPVKRALGKKDFGQWFDIHAEFSPQPTSPNEILISGAPVIEFKNSADGPYSSQQVIFASFGPEVPTGVSVSIEGTHSGAFRWKPGTPPSPGVMLTLEFHPWEPGTYSATIVIRYTSDGVAKTAMRPVLGHHN